MMDNDMDDTIMDWGEEFNKGKMATDSGAKIWNRFYLRWPSLIDLQGNNHAYKDNLKPPFVLQLFWQGRLTPVFFEITAFQCTLLTVLIVYFLATPSKIASYWLLYVYPVRLSIWQTNLLTNKRFLKLIFNEWPRMMKPQPQTGKSVVAKKNPKHVLLLIDLQSASSEVTFLNWLYNAQ